MLAQNFKSAADLGLTEPQHDALIKTLELMDGGKIFHVAHDLSLDEMFEFTGAFNMNRWNCGTACCIGGTAELIAGQKLFREFTDGGLEDLFYPPIPRQHMCDDDYYRRITVAQAAIALRSYLTTGDARWDLALAEG